MDLTTAQRDRAAGALLGTAAGDALGADEPHARRPGAWTAATATTLAVAELTAAGADLRDETTLDRLVQRWAWWARNAGDADAHTRPVLSAIGGHQAPAQAARHEAAALHQPGNGSAPLVRTAPIALAYLHDEAALAHAVRAVCELTHPDSDTAEACVLWCAAIRHAVLTGDLDTRIGLDHIATQRQPRWAALLDAATDPAVLDVGNNSTLAALRAACSAITGTPVPADDPGNGVFRVDHLRLALQAGNNTGAAAVTGALLGAAYGASAVPGEWRLTLHGWPGLRTRGLIQLADRTIGADPPRYDYYRVWDGPRPRRHPHDDKVWIGGVGALVRPRPYVPADVDAIVSLCPVADGRLPAGAAHLDVPLAEDAGDTTHLDFVLLDTVGAIESLRAAGHTVFIHGVQATSRAPVIAALYGARRRHLGIDDALDDVLAALEDANPGSDLRAALHRLHPTPGGRL